MFKIELFWHLNCILMLNWIIWNKTVFTFNSVYCRVHWGCRIHWLYLCREVRPSPNKCTEHDTKSDGEVPAMLELWGMWNTPSLPLLPGPLWPKIVALDRALSMGQIELNCILMLDWIVWIRTVWLNWIPWNRSVFDNQTAYLC